MADFGRVLILLGIVFLIVGGVVILVGRLPLIGRLPGDLLFQQDNMTCFFPLATAILLSLVLTVILNVIIRVLNK
jgi:hypothetical protein